MTYQRLQKDLEKYADIKRAKILQRFFKTGKGEYAEGDIFIGLTVPQCRKLAVLYKDLPFDDIDRLFFSKIHEERLIALLILVLNFEKGTDDLQKRIYEYYLSHTQYINNWDLVDLSADKIVGEYLLNHSLPYIENNIGEYAIRRGPVAPHPQSMSSQNKFVTGTHWGSPSRATPSFEILSKLARSENVWERRIAIIATYAFIKSGIHQPTFQIAEILLTDKHDLIHKAVGWMLREVGKRISQEVEKEFLDKHYKVMPRTMLRYALEHFVPLQRIYYMQK